VLPQIIVDPTVSPTLNNGGWVYNAAVLLAVLGVIVALALVFGYMRFAPRFQTDEGARRSVRAPRIQPGRDVRRPVNVTSAPVVVEPPTIAGAVAAPAAPQAAPAAPQAAPAAAPPAPAGSDQTVAPAGAAAPPAAQPVAETASAAPSSPAPAAPVAASTEERPDVSLDEETFQSTLAELIAKGTDRRVAEGQARRAAMIAARKKAGG
jgi:hypothetical protein